MRVYGYARVSSVGQAEGTSLQDQQNAIGGYAAARGLAVTKFYVEAESAVHERIEHREQIRSLLSAVRKGDLVLCDKLDRWSRDPEFTYRSIREILSAGASFYAVGDQCDPSTPEGDTMLGFRVLFAREEHKRIKQRLVGTRRLLRDQGYYVEGLPPVGYVRPKTADRLGHNVLAVDPQWDHVVLYLYERCAAGASISELLDWVRELHPSRGWDKKTLNRALRSRVYLGEIENTQGVWIKGRHVAIVPPSLFARAQVSLDSRRLGGDRLHVESKTRTWLLREVGVCAGCGAKISAAYGASGTEYERHYYRCPRTCEGYVRVEEQDAAASQAVVDRLVELQDLLARPQAPQPVQRDYSARKAQLQRKRERILEAFTDGDMTRDEMRAGLAKVDAERTKIEDAEQQGRKPTRDRREVLARVGEIERAWRGSRDVLKKREVLRLIVHRVRIRRGAAPQFDWKTVEELEVLS